jgi:monoterpene epsilon-lactone hydrolase
MDRPCRHRVSVVANDGRCDMFRPEDIRAFADAYLGSASPEDPRASPLLGVVHVPPALLQVGSTELLLDDARRMHERIRSASGDSQLSVYEGVAHAWHLAIPFMPETTRAVREVASFAQAHLERSHPRACGVLRGSSR